MTERAGFRATCAEQVLESESAEVCATLRALDVAAAQLAEERARKAALAAQEMAGRMRLAEEVAGRALRAALEVATHASSEEARSQPRDRGVTVRQQVPEPLDDAQLEAAIMRMLAQKGHVDTSTICEQLRVDQTRAHSTLQGLQAAFLVFEAAPGSFQSL